MLRYVIAIAVGIGIGVVVTVVTGNSIVGSIVAGFVSTVVLIKLKRD